VIEIFIPTAVASPIILKDIFGSDKDLQSSKQATPPNIETPNTKNNDIAVCSLLYNFYEIRQGLSVVLYIKPCYLINILAVYSDTHSFP
jgi:hypothetical protein